MGNCRIQGRRLLCLLSGKIAQLLIRVKAFEIESGDYFTGRTGSEAVTEAKKKYPDKTFYLARVGSRAAVSFR
jgi:hypothetical protein